jgi:hypothetical protein
MLKKFIVGMLDKNKQKFQVNERLERVKKTKFCLAKKLKVLAYLWVSTHYTLFGHSLVLSYFHVLLVFYYSRINFFLDFAQTLQLTKT